MRFFMLSYEENKDMAEETKLYLENNYNLDVEIIYGEKIGKIKRTKIVFYNFINYILPAMIDYGDECYYIEDDIRFTKNPKDIPDADCVWSVYRKNEKKGITGCQAIYMKPIVYSLIECIKHNYRRQHLDRFLSFILFKEYSCKIKTIILEPKIGYEENHLSLISKTEHWEKYKNAN